MSGNILPLKHTGLNFCLILPSSQPYCLSFFISSASFSPGICILFFVPPPKQVGGGIEAIVPDFSDVDHTGQKVLMATWTASFGFVRV